MLWRQNEEIMFLPQFPLRNFEGEGRGGAQRSSSWVNQEKYYGGTEDKTGKVHTISFI